MDAQPSLEYKVTFDKNADIFVVHVTHLSTNGMGVSSPFIFNTSEEVKTYLKTMIDRIDLNSIT